ncbi:MAG: thioredoxin-dependent thiol peroxidase [Vibrionaceae bacterium]
MTYLSKGATAPDFNLPDQYGRLCSLAQFRGQNKVLLYFYPRASTPGCTTQACGLRDNLAEFSQYNTVVLGISPDPSARLAKFNDSKSLNFTLLSDIEHKIADAYGAWGDKTFLGKHYDGIHRISYLIDEQGKIIHVFDKFTTKNHHQTVLDFLASLP